MKNEVEAGMRRMMGVVAAGLVLMAAGGARAESVLEQWLGSYDAVKTLSCEIRRDLPLPGGDVMRMLSRVYYERPDRLHVENFSPVSRRTVSDGQVFRQYAEGAKRGFSRPVPELNDEMLRNLRMVPGSAANILEVLRGVEETELAATDEYPRRVAYDNGNSVAVLNLDRAGRLARFELYGSAAMTDLKTRMDFSAYQEILPGVWLACVQEARVLIEGLERTETTRISNVIVNEEIPAGLFEPDGFFRGVEFVDSFDKILP